MACLRSVCLAAVVIVALGGIAQSQPSEVIYFYTADGLPVYILAQYGRTPFVQDFDDYLELARAYGSSTGDSRFNVLADINDDGTVSFSDFIAFAQAYGREAVPVENPPIYTVSGRVLYNGAGLAGVRLQIPDRTTAYDDTDAEGSYRISGIPSGSHNLLPIGYGYRFIPESRTVALGDSLVVDVDFSAELAFSTVSARVVQDSLPAPEVVVRLERTATEDSSGHPWEGTTDPIGQTVIRVDADPTTGRTGGTYLVTARDVASGTALGEWAGVAISDWDTRWLVLDLNGGVTYQEDPRPHYYSATENGIVYPEVSEEGLVAGFSDSTGTEEVEALLDSLELIVREAGRIPFSRTGAPIPGAGDPIILELRHRRGWAAVREALHLLRSSGIAALAEPLFGSLTSAAILTDRVEVLLNTGSVESDVLDLIESFGCEVVAGPTSDDDPPLYAVRVKDPLRNRVLDVANALHEHPMVEYAAPQVAGFTVMFGRTNALSASGLR